MRESGLFSSSGTVRNYRRNRPLSPCSVSTIRGSDGRQGAPIERDRDDDEVWHFLDGAGLSPRDAAGAKRERGESHHT